MAIIILVCALIAVAIGVSNVIRLTYKQERAFDRMLVLIKQVQDDLRKPTHPEPGAR